MMIQYNEMLNQYFKLYIC